jgi:hypothetical protein
LEPDELECLTNRTRDGVEATRAAPTHHAYQLRGSIRGRSISIYFETHPFAAADRV